MKYIGAHVSAAGGVQNAPLNAETIGAKAFALFIKNQRQWETKPLTDNAIKEFKENCKKFNYSKKHILPHDSYLINLGHPEMDALEKSRNAFVGEIQRCEALGLQFLNFHPGSSLARISKEECSTLVAESINISIEKSSELILVIENTAGMGSTIGSNFEEIAQIIGKVENKNRIGVCIDTCHAFAAGYDIRSEKKYEKMMSVFDDIVGLSYLKGMHLNDSKAELGSHLDRHAPIGKGYIGLDAFRFIMNDRRFDDMPLILETPNGDNWNNEITLLYSLQKKQEVQ
ncbi:MAG TPA: deoxyribonuclease IV [Candidatus Cloacimonetes bacterium]|nr:deoxyribonuclease IV [Candidatus Cloacimonadota bacterium]